MLLAPLPNTKVSTIVKPLHLLCLAPKNANTAALASEPALVPARLEHLPWARTAYLWWTKKNVPDAGYALMPVRAVSSN